MGAEAIESVTDTEVTAPETKSTPADPATTTTSPTVTPEAKLKAERAKRMEAMLAEFKKVAKGVADEIVERQLGQIESTLETETQRRFEAQVAQRSYKELTEGKHVFGAIAYAIGRCLREKKSDVTPMEIVEKMVGAPLVRSLNLQDAGSGGILIQGEVLDLFYGPLEDKAVVLSLNPRTIPLVADTMTLTGFETAPEITWVGEPNTSEVVSEPTTGARQLTAKKAMLMVPITNDFLDAPQSPAIVREIEALVQNAFRRGFDLQLIRGTGSAFAPKGLRNWAGNTDAMNSGGATPLHNVLLDLSAVLNTMESNNVPMERVGVIFAPRTKNYFMVNVLDGNNQPFFLNEMRQGTFMGYPFRWTNQIPTNLGGGSNESYNIWADFSEVVFGRGTDLRMDQFDQATYTQGGSMQSTVQRDETLLRGKQKMDLAVPHDDAVYVTTGVTYGA